MKKSVTRKYLPCEIMLFMIFIWGPKSDILWNSTLGVNASLTALQLQTHDSGPMWVANPSSYGTLIHYFPPVFTGAPNLLILKSTKFPSDTTVQNNQFDTIPYAYVFLASIFNNSQAIHPVNLFRIG